MLNLNDIVHHLLVEQRVNVLDRTKCSTSARHIYNFLCNAGDVVQHNNNLIHIECSNLHELAQVLKNDPHHAIACYVHFHHLTNETSHYFILLRIGTDVLVLQSAVFEYNIHEFLFPSVALEAAASDIKLAREELAQDDDMRARFLLEQRERDHVQRVSILESIRACRYSSGRVMSVDEFADTFLVQLASLEGVWTDENVDRNCETFQALFACQLNRDIIRSHVRLGGIQPASVKFIFAPIPHRVVGCIH
jgi:hypothetical protein